MVGRWRLCCSRRRFDAFINVQKGLRGSDNMGGWENSLVQAYIRSRAVSHFDVDIHWRLNSKYNVLHEEEEAASNAARNE